MNYIFTCIIPYKHKIDRLVNLKKVLEWLSGFNGLEIIVVEQDSSSKLQNFSLKGFKHIFTESKMPFNRAWAFNVGLKNASTNAIVFMDGDILMDPNQFINSIKKLELYDCVVPHDKIVNLDPTESNQPINTASIKEGAQLSKKLTKCIVYRRDSILKIGGWCEDVFGTGSDAEEEFQLLRSKKLLNFHQSEGISFHLYHNPNEDNQFIGARNVDILMKYLSMNDSDLSKYSNNVLNKIGMKNRLVDK